MNKLKFPVLYLALISLLLLAASPPDFYHPGHPGAGGEWCLDPSGTFLIPCPSSKTVKKKIGEVLRLTIVNNSAQDFHMQLDGPNFHYLTVPKHSTGIFTLIGEVYEATVFGCGVTKQSTYVHYTQKKLIVQPCEWENWEVYGLWGWTFPTPQKIVKIHITNETDVQQVVYLSGTAGYVLPVPGGTTKAFTIPKGEYNFSTSCEQAGQFRATSRAELVVDCE